MTHTIHQNESHGIIISHAGTILRYFSQSFSYPQKDSPVSRVPGWSHGVEEENHLMNTRTNSKSLLTDRLTRCPSRLPSKKQ